MTEEKDKLEHEQGRVDWIIGEIKAKQQKYGTQSGQIESEALEIRRTFWQDVTVNVDEPDDIAETFTSIKQQAELLSERERSQGQLDKQLRTLNRLSHSPYFGRIDFTEDGEKKTENIYIGIASFMDADDEEFLIYDWRAPISSMYYDYAPGPASYETSMETVKGKMELKRQYVIRDGKIKAMFDTGVTIGDEMLQEVLGNQADTQMKSIVATIQREQNQIIRNDSSPILIVKGVAGSGKTSAAMQRVAYLLYKYRTIISSENMMLFSPNPMFNSYVSTVLPELGEENMQQATYQEYLLSRIDGKLKLEDMFSQMEELLSYQNGQNHETKIESIRFKSTLDFKKLIDQYADGLGTNSLIFKPIVFKGRTLFSSSELSERFYSLDSKLPLPNRIRLLQDSLIKQLRKIARSEEKAEWVEDELQYLDKEEYLDAFRHVQKRQGKDTDSFDDYQQEQKFLARIIVSQKMKRVFNQVKRMRFIDHLALYRQFFTAEHNQDQLPPSWNEIKKLTINDLDSLKISYEDATPFLYLQDLIEGRKSNPSIRHVFIDEAQDYTPFQLAYIRQLYPYSKMTLLGDLNQAVYSGPTKAKTVLSDDGLGQEQRDVITLNRTYRSTKEIVEFSRALVEGGEQIIPFNRKGSLPEIAFIGTLKKREMAIQAKLKSLMASGNETIAVIGRTAQETEEAYQRFGKESGARLISKNTIAYEKGISFIPAYLAKGIEFDAVILLDASEYKTHGETQLFYTASTRAMHELFIYASEDAPLLEGISKELYKIAADQ